MPHKTAEARAAYARRRKEAGKCVSCGELRINATHCAKCRDIHNGKRRKG